jgi:hypothetical protein
MSDPKDKTNRSQRGIDKEGSEGLRERPLNDEAKDSTE